VPYGRGTDTFLLVPTTSGARSLKDLQGKRIAVHRGRPWYLAFLRLVEQSGLQPGDFTLVNMDLQPGAAALASGNVDAMFTISAYTLADKGLARIIWSSKGQVDKKIRAELWGAKTFIDTHPDLTQLVVTAYIRAQYWESQQQNRQAIVDEAVLSGKTRRAAEEEFDDNTLVWKDFFTPITDAAVLEHYRLAVQFAEDKHLVRTPLRVEDLLQTKFVVTALDELRLQHFWAQVPVIPRSAGLAVNVKPGG
jgi:sulfonate transport system substrate-binding protein